MRTIWRSLSHWVDMYHRLSCHGRSQGESSKERNYKDGKIGHDAFFLSWQLGYAVEGLELKRREECSVHYQIAPIRLYRVTKEATEDRDSPSAPPRVMQSCHCPPSSTVSKISTQLPHISPLLSLLPHHPYQRWKSTCGHALLQVQTEELPRSRNMPYHSRF